MQKANAPIQFVLPFAGSATSQYRNVIPIPSQQGVTPGAASMTDGFPPVTMEPTASGGIPPYGADMNGILYEATLALQWQQAGYVYGYNSTFATNVNVGGYPAGALLRSTAVPSLWLSTTDNNATNPDTSAGANWVPFLPNYGAVSVNTAGGTTTLTMNQMTAPYIYVTGALTSNATLVLPLITGSHFIVYNNTTGAFTLTVQSSTGASVAVTQGQSQWVYCDSANWHGLGLVGGPYLPLNGTAQAAVKLATARNFSITGKLSAGPISFNGTADVTFNITNVVADSLATPRAFQIGGLASAAAVNFDGTGPVTLNVTSVNVPAALGYTPANDASVVHDTGTETIAGNKTLTGQTLLASNVAAGNNIDQTAAMSQIYSLEALTTGSGGTLGLGFSPYKPIAFLRAFIEDAGGSHKGRLVLGVKPSSTSTTLNWVMSLGSDLNVSFAGAITATGGITAASYNTSSDPLLKDDLVPQTWEHRVDDIGLWDWTWNSLSKQPGQRSSGVRSDEVRKVFPQCVHKDTDGFDTVDYGNLGVHMAANNSRCIRNILRRLSQLERRA